jgi:hypothetical protein
LAYIGNIPAEKYSSFVKQDFTTSATTSYTLDHPVANGNEIALFINFVRQEPTAAYTASGTSLTLTSATTSSDDMYCVYLGKAVQTVNPPNGSVGASQLASDAVTAAKLNDDIISGQTALASEPADTDEFLVSDAGTLKRIDYSLIKGGGITVADNWRLSSDVTSDTSPLTNWEQNDTAGAGQIGTSMSVSSGAFTFPSTGIYLVTLSALVTEGSAADNIIQVDGYFNSVRMIQIFLHVNSNNDCSTGTNQAIIDVDDVSKTFYVNFVNNTSSGSLRGSTDANQTNLAFIRLGDT